MRTLGIPALVLAVVLAWQPSRPVAAHVSDNDEVERITKSIEVLRDLTSAPDEGIPQYLLERAEGIVVIPNLVKGGFVVGAKHGLGVVSVRDRARNTWSAPVFVKMTGGSIGWQIGVQSTDLVLLVMNRAGRRGSAGGQVHAWRQSLGRRRAGRPQRATPQRTSRSRARSWRIRGRRVCLPAPRSRAVASAPTTTPTRRSTAVRSAFAPSWAAGRDAEVSGGRGSWTTTIKTALRVARPVVALVVDRTSRETKKESAMNQDVLKGKWMQLKGEVRTQWGKLTNDDLDQIEGNAEKLIGQASGALRLRARSRRRRNTNAGQTALRREVTP